MVHSFIQRGLQDIERSAHVRLDVRSWGHVRIRDRDEGCEMKDLVAAAHGFSDNKGVPNVCREHLHILQNLPWKGLQPPPMIERVVVNHRSNMIPRFDELLY
jgi:hypothetical protein